MVSPSELAEGASSSSIQVCVLCSKPFTNRSSYKRHSTYCRRNADRPRKRGKSCQACSRAKAKCSFHPHCFRCISKGLECTYDHRSVSSSQPGPSTGSIQSHDLSMLNFGNNTLLDLSDIPHFDQELDGKSPDKQNEIATFTSLSQFPTLNFLIPSSPNYLTIENFAASRVDSINSVGTLEHLRIPDPIAQQSATLVMQALRAIPERMLRRDTFPPFIHPQPHRQSLPEPLAICIRIAQIFATRTPDIGSFIWRSIKAEQIRVLTEYDKLSKQDLLAALQAQVVYIVMRVIDGSREPLGWNREMLVIGGSLCKRFKDMCNEPFCQDELSRPSLTWEDWIFAESRRRTSCTWFLLSCIVSVKSGLYCDTLEDFRMLPLPSPKVRWEASSHIGWEKELEFDCNSLWTFGGLLDAHKWCNEPSSIQRLDSWNARTDNLGSLMNIATGIMCKRE